jgi:hypothetical protein
MAAAREAQLELQAEARAARYAQPRKTTVFFHGRHGFFSNLFDVRWFLHERTPPIRV